MMTIHRYRDMWEELAHRRRAVVLSVFVSSVFFAIFVGVKIGPVFMLLVFGVFFWWLGRFLNRSDEQAAAVVTQEGATISTASTMGPAGLGPENERVEQRTTIVGRGMTREQMCAFINQRIEQHGFLRVSAEITTHPGQSGALLYTVTLDGHVPPPPQTGVSSSWLPP